MKYRTIPTIIPMNPQRRMNKNILSFYRSSKSFFDRPMFESPMHKSRVGIKCSSPVSEQLSLSIERNRSDTSLISPLLFSCSPLAVLSAIVSIVIYPLNLGVFLTKLFNMFKIRKIHIITKLIERIPKALYSTTTIILVANMFRIIASVPKIAISLIEASLSHSMIPLRQFSSYTITRRSLTRLINNSVSRKDFLISAITLKQPVVFRPTTTHESHRHQLSKPLPRNIFHIVLPLQARRIGRSVPTVAPMLLMS